MKIDLQSQSYSWRSYFSILFFFLLIFCDLLHKLHLKVPTGAENSPPNFTERFDKIKAIFNYSKASRCTFFRTRKNPCSSKFVQLLLLNKVRARSSKKCRSRFSLHKSVYLKLFWTQLETVHLQGPCCLRPCSSRHHCK